MTKLQGDLVMKWYDAETDEWFFLIRSDAEEADEFIQELAVMGGDLL